MVSAVGSRGAVGARGGTKDRPGIREVCQGAVRTQLGTEGCIGVGPGQEVREGNSGL